MKRLGGLLAVLWLAGVLFLPHVARAQADEPFFPIPDLSVRIPGAADPLTNAVPVDCPDNFSSVNSIGCYAFPWIGQYIRALYVFAVYASTIAAAIMVMVGGFIWLTAGGNIGAIGTAKGYISGAILGLSLMLGSYTILRLVNPDLVTFQAIAVPALRKVPLEEVSEAITGSKEKIAINCTQGSIPEGSISAYDKLINEAAAGKVDPFLLAAIVDVESDFDPTVTNKQGLTAALGMTQILPTTAQSILNRNSTLAGQLPASCRKPPKNPNHKKGDKTPVYLFADDCKAAIINNPKIQLEMAADYLVYIQKYIGGEDPTRADDLGLVVGGYKQGEGNAVKLLQNTAKAEVAADVKTYFANVQAAYRKYCPEVIAPTAGRQTPP